MLGRKGQATEILLLTVMVGVLTVTFFSGASQQATLRSVQRIAVKTNLVSLYRSIGAAVDCPRTIADAANIANCTAWQGITTPTGQPSGTNRFIRLYGHGPQFASANITEPAGGVQIGEDGLTNVRVMLRARCLTAGNPRRILPEIQLVDRATNLPSPLNNLFEGRDGWINVFAGVEGYANPFSRADCTP